jgi:hypothetical protein
MQARACLLVLPLLLQACRAAPGGAEQTPVLEFPEAGVDDPVAYEGYVARFFRDASGNTFQVYLNQRDGRVVHVWADAANESAGFTARDAGGRAWPVVWGGPGAAAESKGPSRTMRYRLAADVATLEIGWFLLGTMRQERDFQYQGWHRRPYGDPPFILPELTSLIESLERLPTEQQTRHLTLLAASDVAELRSRLESRVSLSENEVGWSVLVEHTSLDGRNRLMLELSGDASAATATLVDDRVLVRARNGGSVEFEVAVTTDSDALTPLGPERLFNQVFRDYTQRQQRRADSLDRTLTADQAARNPQLVALRRFERQVLALQLLSSEEKLIASLPNYATYFGRDQMMSALMLEPISSGDLQELVIASVLGKLAASGNVSHEEALGGQAIRENAAEYSSLIRAWEQARASDPEAAVANLTRARELLENLQAVRENYRMVDDDLQLPVLVDRYLARSDVPTDRKRRFLTDSAGPGPPRLEALMRNLAFAAELARPYAEQPTATNLVSFFQRDDEGWLPGSWRDSRVGYGGGRFAMDVNVVWVPQALEAIERILRSVDELGLSAADALARVSVNVSALDAYLQDPAALRAAIATWRGARRHFEVRLDAAEMRRRIDSALQSMSGPEREYWRQLLDQEGVAQQPLSFLALSLDSQGRPVAAANSDPATDLFLVDYTEEILSGAADPAAVLQMLDVFARPYPVGLFVAGLGPVVVNDMYASPTVQQRFRADAYHSPRVVWGREVNLLLLGLARQIEAAYDASGRLRDDSEEMHSYVAVLRRTLDNTRTAVEASGLSHNELWSYRIDDGTLRPVRYGTSSDIQLWNVTDLAVGFLLDRLPPR